MKNLNLNLNDRTSKLRLLEFTDSIIKTMSDDYLKFDKFDDSNLNIYLINTYPYFMSLVELLDHDHVKYSLEDLLIIANTIYFNKGTVQTIKNFLNYFDIIGDITYSRLNIELTSNLINAESDSYTSFIDRFIKFYKDIMIVNTHNDSFVTMVVKCNFKNKITNEVDTVLINILK